MTRSVFRSELRSLFALALPLAAAQAGTQLMSIVDIAMLGRVGATELASAGLAHAFFFAFSVAGMGLAFGVDPLISQAIGAGEPLRARRAMWQGIWLVLCGTVVLTLPLVGATFALPYLGVQPELVAPTTTYLLIRTVGLAPFLTFLVLRAYLQAVGITKPMLVSMIVANVVNFAGNVIFVFGVGPIPAMGVSGSALSTVFAQFCQLGILVHAVLKVRVDQGQENIRRWNGSQVRQAFRVGFPVAVQLSAEIGIFALVGVLAARLGTNELAAHQLVLGLASFTYTIALGIAAAGSVRVGLAVGARDHAATRAAGYAALVGGATVMAITGGAFALFPTALGRLLTNQEIVIATAVPLFMVAAVFQLSDGIQAVGAGALRGAADTRFSLWANLLGHWAIGLPVALWLGFHQRMGIVGLWWGLCAGLTVVAVALFVRFDRLSARVIQRI
ncbi:MAG TPA: MATE family efflux transporter [Thermoanaerobaculia bacterium]|jgi:MATE family multidrug resistance protein